MACQHHQESYTEFWLLFLEKNPIKIIVLETHVHPGGIGMETAGREYMEFLRQIKSTGNHA
jgi:hypothetical protein